MSDEALLGFGAFHTKKVTGTDVIDFVKFRQLVAKAELLDDAGTHVVRVVLGAGGAA